MEGRRKACYGAINAKSEYMLHWITVFVSLAGTHRISPLGQNAFAVGKLECSLIFAVFTSYISPRRTRYMYELSNKYFFGRILSFISRPGKLY